MSCGGKRYEENWVRWQSDRKMVIGNRENKAHRYLGQSTTSREVALAER